MTYASHSLQLTSRTVTRKAAKEFVPDPYVSNAMQSQETQSTLRRSAEGSEAIKSGSEVDAMVRNENTIPEEFLEESEKSGQKSDSPVLEEIGRMEPWEQSATDKARATQDNWTDGNMEKVALKGE
jgi:hypothetical protein